MADNMPHSHKARWKYGYDNVLSRPNWVIILPLEQYQVDGSQFNNWMYIYEHDTQIFVVSNKVSVYVQWMTSNDWQSFFIIRTAKYALYGNAYRQCWIDCDVRFCSSDEQGSTVSGYQWRCIESLHCEQLCLWMQPKVSHEILLPEWIFMTEKPSCFPSIKSNFDRSHKEPHSLLLFLCERERLSSLRSGVIIIHPPSSGSPQNLSE